MSKAYDILVAGLRETVYGNATALATRELQILPSTHGDQSGVRQRRNDLGRVLVRAQSMPRSNSIGFALSWPARES